MDQSPILSLATGLSAAVLISSIAWFYLKPTRHGMPYPPGPKPLPIIGNLLDLPRGKEWLAYHSMALRHGEIMHLEALGQHIIVLDSARAAFDLLERRSSITSSRPNSVMLGNLMGLRYCNLVMREYGESWRNERRLLHSHMHTNVVHKFQALQTRWARHLLKALLKDPDDFLSCVRGSIGSIILDTVYGVQVTSHTDPRLVIAEKVNKMTMEAVLPGAFLVDAFPMLKYLPEWFPGATFHKFAKEFRLLYQSMVEEPVREIEEDMARGTAKSCIVLSLLEDSPHPEMHEKHRKVVKDVAGVAYQAGADTTVSTLLCFFLAMANYPEVQKKAQVELDTVVGCDRLPEFSDRSSLPYVNAIILELLRWQPVANLGLPHTTVADNEYNGFFIPKGATIIYNAWSILHDPIEYPDPQQFRPERFIESPNGAAARDPRDVAFGYGRRVCPGRHFAEQTIFLAVVSVLSTFVVAPSVDERGLPVPCKVEMETGTVSLPAPFKCSVTVRSQAAVDLVNQPLPDRGL